MSRRSAWKLYESYEGRGHILSTGDAILDATLGGGILTNGITEIAGEAGVGKTQLCLTLALQAYLDTENGGMESGAMYLNCGEGQFPDRRLEQLASTYASKYENKSSTSSDSSTSQSTNTDMGKQKRPMSFSDFMNNVYIEKVHSTDQALEMLSKQVPELIRKKEKDTDKDKGSIRLLIFDSLAGLIRTEFDSSNSNDMKSRTMVLFSLATKLKWLADTYNLCVVVVNQVTAGGFDNQSASASGGSSSISGNSQPVPALGLVWATCVNTRIQLRRDNHSRYGTSGSGSIQDDDDSLPGDELGQGHANRSLNLHFSPIQPPGSCTYRIASDGLHGVYRFL
jgi:DNA-repair protein XRCC3